MQKTKLYNLGVGDKTYLKKIILISYWYFGHVFIQSVVWENLVFVKKF